MQKQGFTIIEVTIVFLLILAAAFFIIPTSMDTTKQARFISMWTEKYSELQYMFQTIKAQHEETIKNDFENAQNSDDGTKILLEIIKPYLRITSKINSSDYQQKYMNDSMVSKTDRYYFDHFYLTSSKEVIGLKYIQSKCSGRQVCAIICFDLNGTEAPNTWGYDVFGINVLKDKIEPIGKDIIPEVLKMNCSKHGFGVYCSYYYLIGGRFD